MYPSFLGWYPTLRYTTASDGHIRVSATYYQGVTWLTLYLSSLYDQSKWSYSCGG